MTRKIAAFAVPPPPSGSPPAANEEPTGTVSPAAAKAKVEQAAQVKLAVESVPDEAREQGLQASYSNASTVAADKQVVGLFVVKNADLAGKVVRRRSASRPRSRPS